MLLFLNTLIGCKIWSLRAEMSKCIKLWIKWDRFYCIAEDLSELPRYELPPSFGRKSIKRSFQIWNNRRIFMWKKAEGNGENNWPNYWVTILSSGIYIVKLDLCNSQAYFLQTNWMLSVFNQSFLSLLFCLYQVLNEKMQSHVGCLFIKLFFSWSTL